MATTTTNFGWDIPQSTDLVKDGATAIAALGQDIDTALVDLKGGTTGQVLAKASGTDLDFSWVAQDDSNAIQNAIVDAKGDLITATAADTPARLAVGTNGHVLTADSTAATGIKWAAIAAAQTYAVFTDQKTAGSHGGTFTSGAWRTRDINNTQYNNITSASIASNQITLPAGTYQLSAYAPFGSVNQCATRLYNITDSSTTIFGSTEYNDQTDPFKMTKGFVEGIFTIAGTKVFEVQQYGAATKSTTGFGQGTGYQVETYTIVKITKI